MNETSTLNCTDCGLEMEAGFFPELGHGSVAAALNWQPGGPDRKYLLGFIPPGIKVDPKAGIRVTALRCVNCGLLKLYALAVPEEPEPSEGPGAE